MATLEAALQGELHEAETDIRGITIAVSCGGGYYFVDAEWSSPTPQLPFATKRVASLAAITEWLARLGIDANTLDWREGCI